MSGFVAEIHEQPEALHRVLDHFSAESLYPWAKKLKDGALKRVVFTGMGSSYHAAAPAVIMLEEHGITASAVEASELVYYGKLDAQTLLVGISQSGKSVEVVRLIESINKSNANIPIIGVTNDAESPLALHSDAVIMLHAGTELTVSSKTYTNTLAVLDLLARTLGSVPTQPALENLHLVADQMTNALPEWSKQAEAIADSLSISRFLMFLGRGPSRTSAMTGALIMKESTKLATEGMVSGQFRHGPIEVVSREMATFIFASPGRATPLNLGLARDLTQLSGQVFVIGSEQVVPGAVRITTPQHPAIDEWIAPIVEMIPIQLIAATLATQRGFDTSRFVHGSKVTTRE